VATRCIVEKELEEKAALAIPVKSTDSSPQLGKPKPLQPITGDSG